MRKDREYVSNRTSSQGAKRKTKQNCNNNGEFDPGSGCTLAIGLTHASRGAARGSNTLAATGARVRNTYVTYLLQSDNTVKVVLIRYSFASSHGHANKDSSVRDRHAVH